VVSSTLPPASLRERKKARTRAALIEVSQRLFAEQGYSVTTLEEICAEVEVTPQTLLRYFPSKAHLALAPMADAVGQLREFLERPERQLATLVVWQEYLTIEAQEVDAPSSPIRVSQVENLRAYRRWTDRDPVLVAMASDLDRQLVEMLAAAMARDWDLAADDLHAAIVAGALVAGRTATWSRWLDGDAARAPLTELLATVAYVEHRLDRSTASGLLPDSGDALDPDPDPDPDPDLDHDRER
jgi:AcrR family transcriptional regulator